MTLGTAGLPASTTPVTFDSTNIALASPTTDASGNFSATGYHFAGWESPVDLTNGGSPSSGTYVLYQGTQASSPNGNYTGGTLASYGYANPAQNGTVTLNAHWVPNQYTITYNKGAGAGSNYAHTNGATFDTAYTIPSTGDAGTGVSGASTAQSGYTFIGWSTDAEPTVTRTTGNAGTVSNSWNGITTWTSADATDLTVYAAYLANQYSLTYTCGTPAAGVTPTGPANGVSPQTVVYATGFNLAAATACTATGYHITGWSCPDFSGASGNSTTYSASAAVAAYNIDAASSCTGQWAANTTTITYDCGSNAGSGSAAPGDGTATYGQTFAFAANPASNGCVIPTGSTFNGWRCKVGGTGSDLNATALYGNGVTSTTLQTAGGAGATWTYTGEHAGTIACVADITANSINLTWYTDTVEHNGQLITPSNSEANSCTYGGIITTPAGQPEQRPGYTFNGWHVR